MLKNYFKTAFRSVWKTRGYSFLNIFGLAIGITAASLIFLWVEDEVNYNDHFDHKENIYSVKNRQTYDGQTFVFSSTPGPLGPAMATDFPQVKHVARTSWQSKLLFGLGDKKLYEQGYYVDPDFTNIFSVDFIEGDVSTALSQPTQVAISESMAKRLFNRTNVVGETIRVKAEEDFTVSGVFKDLPQNVSLAYDWLMPFQIHEKANDWLEHWGNNGIQTFALLDEQANLSSVNEKLYTFIPDKSGNDGFTSKLMLYPMSRWKLYNAFDTDGNEIEGSVKYVRLFSTIAWVILIIACINFMNLATARSQKRAKEIGVKKVVGAGRGALIGQFIFESVLLSAIAGLVAIGLSVALLPYFNTIVNKGLSLGLRQPGHVLFLLGVIAISGLVAGSYPAFYLSSFNPVKVFKGLGLKTGGANFVRRGLVVLQFAASITLVICTTIIYTQIQYAKNKDIGYERDGLIATNIYPKIANHFDAIKHELKQNNLVENISRTNHNILNLGSNTGDFFWEGKDPNLDVLITLEYADADYIGTMGMKLLEGRTFKEDLNADSNNVIINRTLASMMGIEENPIGQRISRSWGDFTIIGMVDDFMVTDVYSPTDPMVINPLLRDGSILTMRIQAGNDMAQTLAGIESVFKKYNADYPFEYRFIDEQFERMFRTEMLIGTLTRIFAIMAIIISCLGLLGLAAYTAERRTKEIGVRKVLGASVLNLTNLLNKEFIILVGISCLLAFPISYLMMESWLGGYSYRISISIWSFLLAGVLALLVAVVTVSTQAIKAALANPVESLRDE